jgi:hypothetical protein
MFGIILSFHGNWALILLFCVKLVLFIMFVCMEFFVEKNQKVRNLIIQFLHFVLLGLILFYQCFLKNS